MVQTKDNTDLQPMTIGHGRKLFAKSAAIVEQIDQLKPLLTLLQNPQEVSDEDPINQITGLMEKLVTHSRFQSEELQVISSKLDSLLEILSAGEP